MNESNEVLKKVNHFLLQAEKLIAKAKDEISLKDDEDAIKDISIFEQYAAKAVKLLKHIHHIEPKDLEKFVAFEIKDLKMIENTCSEIAADLHKNHSDRITLEEHELDNLIERLNEIIQQENNLQSAA